MKTIKLLWNLVGVLVALQYGYWAVRFTLVYFGLSEPPKVSANWMALGFWGAATLSAQLSWDSFFREGTE